jgi:hypothetical protein
MDCKGGSIGIGWDVARRGGFHRPGTAAAASLVTNTPSFTAAAQTDARVGTSMTKNLGFTIPGTSQGATGEVRGYHPHHTTPTVAWPLLVSHVDMLRAHSGLSLSLSFSFSFSLSTSRCLCPPRPFVYLFAFFSHILILMPVWNFLAERESLERT